MKKYGILHKPDLAQKAHDGEKTVTRRLMKPQPFCPGATIEKHKDGWRVVPMYTNPHDDCDKIIKPRYQVGMVLAVRETHWRWGRHERNDKGSWRFVPQKFIEATDTVFLEPKSHLISTPKEKERLRYHKRPSIHMPFDLARTYVEIVSARPERLHDITVDEALAEGVQCTTDCSWCAREEFKKLWDSINAARCPWSSNPWIWRYEYKRVDKPS